MIEAKLFSTEQELTEMTGLNHDELWRNLFNLDDWNCGIAIPTDKWEEYNDRHYPVIGMMENWCCGTEAVEYNGWTYVMLYHG